MDDVATARLQARLAVAAADLAARTIAAPSPPRIALAESCTGGMAAAAITDLAGVSAWFAGGVVSYSDDAKIALLNVSPATLQKHGAVSEEAAREMCRGVCSRLNADLAAAITGVAGPGGGGAQKPVGTVCFAWGAANAPLDSTSVRFGGGREQVRLAAAAFALSRLAATAASAVL